MPAKTGKDLWFEMSVREAWTQAHFAGIAYANIDPKARNGVDAVFSSIHSFLSHCAMVSKMLKAAPEDTTPSKSVGDVLGISESSVIHQRTFRNNLEHYDERLKAWIKRLGANITIGTYNIGPKSAFQVPNMVFVSHYDPTTNTFTFINEEFNLLALYNEVERIKGIADIWVKNMEKGLIAPPFI